MNKLIEKPVFVILLLTIISAYLFFFRLDGLALTDPDETFYAQTAKEMHDRGEWLTPYLFGKPQFEKPILFYWLVEASFKIFMVNEFGARFPSALFGFIGLVAVYLLGRTLFSNRVGILSSIMLATCVEYVILSRACITDMVLFAFMALGALFFFYGYKTGKPIHYILSSVMFGLAVLTKGPIFILLPAAAFFIFLFAVKDMKALRKVPILWCAAAFLVTALPWYIVMYRVHGMEFIDAFFGFHNVTRFLEAEHKIGSQFYYNIPIILGGYFPWSVFLPFGLWSMYKKIKSKSSSDRKGSIFVLSWLAVIFAFFTVSSTKLPTYIFPVFLSTALVTGLAWDGLIKPGSPKWAAKGMKISFYSLPVMVILGAIGALIYAKIDYQSIFTGILVSSSVLALGIALSAAAFFVRKYLWAFALIVYALSIFLLPVSKLILPEIEPYETSRDVSRLLNFRMSGDERLGSESNYLAGLAFYTGRYPIDVDKHHNLVQFLASKERVWCVMKDKNHRELYELETKPYCTRPSYMIYKVGKRSVVTNVEPDDGVYILKRERVE